MVDRVVVREGSRPRLAESINLAVRHGDGLVLASCEETQAAASGVGTIAVQHAVRLPELQDQLRGAGAADVQLQQSLRRLPDLRGAGRRAWRSIPTWSLPDAGAVAGRRGDRAVERRRRRRRCGSIAELLAAVADPTAGIRWNTPLDEAASPRPCEQLLHGDGKQFPGVLALLEKEYATTDQRGRSGSGWRRFAAKVVCPECGGARLRPEARAVRIGGQGDPRGRRP